MAKIKRISNPKYAKIAEIIAEENPGATAEEIYGVLTSLFADTLERLLHAELDAELGYQKHDQSPKTTTNRRNGSNSKTVLTKEGEMTINVPRDREGVFEPMILPKHERNVSRIQDKVLAMYKRGMSDRDISQTVEEIYGFGVSHETISNITDTILPTVKEWRSRPLKEVYTFVHIDALFTDVKIHGVSQKRAVYVALAIDTEGRMFWVCGRARQKAQKNG